MGKLYFHYGAPEWLLLYNRFAFNVAVDLSWWFGGIEMRWWEVYIREDGSGFKKSVFLYITPILEFRTRMSL